MKQTHRMVDDMNICSNNKKSWCKQTLETYKGSHAHKDDTLKISQLKSVKKGYIVHVASPAEILLAD